jgi:hypothetical protein
MADPKKLNDVGILGGLRAKKRPITPLYACHSWNQKQGTFPIGGSSVDLVHPQIAASPANCNFHVEMGMSTAAVFFLSVG